MKKNLYLFCLPFAGGNKYSYREFIEKAPLFLKPHSLEYPGRGSRIKEPLISDINVLVEDLYEQLKNIADRNEYAMYGHSMGGLLTYLLTIKMIKNNLRPPVHLFITGTTGPSAISRKEKARHLMEKNDFIQEIKDLNGMPDEILQSEEMLHYFEPILRSDFQASENYIYEDHAPLDIPFTVITGTQEDMEIEDIELWQNETTFPVDFKKLPGNHFFILKYSREIMEIISKKLYKHTSTFIK